MTPSDQSAEEREQLIAAAEYAHADDADQMTYPDILEAQWAMERELNDSRSLDERHFV